MSKHAVVILMSDGYELTENQTIALGNCIQDTCRCEQDVTIKLLDENDMASAIFAHVVEKQPEVSVKIDTEGQLEKSMLIIRDRFADTMIGADRDIVAFATALTRAITKARLDNTDDELIIAVENLVNHQEQFKLLPMRVRQKYGFCPSVYNAVCTAFMPLLYVSR